MHVQILKSVALHWLQGDEHEGETILGNVGNSLPNSME